MFSEATYQIVLYTEENSGLANNEINALVMNHETGILFIGTGNGLSSLKTPFSEPKPDLGEIKIYPNPFMPMEHDHLIIDELAQDVSVHIYTSSGYLVRQFSLEDVTGRRLFWDGLNQVGEPISGGIYLIVVSTDSGESSKGKVAVVR